jgi:hypothetical protein
MMPPHINQTFFIALMAECGEAAGETNEAEAYWPTSITESGFPVEFERWLCLPARSPLFCALNTSELARRACLRERKGFRQKRLNYR